MRFTAGATRWVILVGPYAVKIARLRFLWAIKRLVEHLLRGCVREKLRAYGSTTLSGGFRYIFVGFFANRLEARLWTESHWQHLAPTLFSFFGLINIQRRGEQIWGGEMLESHPFPTVIQRASIHLRWELSRSVQFCRIDGHIRLADYGGFETYAYLAPLVREVPQPQLVRAQLS